MNLNNPNDKLTSSLDLIKVSSALRDLEATKFVRNLISNHYQQTFGSKVMESTINIVFRILEESQEKKISIVKLGDAINNILNKKLFTNSDLFSKEYLKYKKETKPEFYFRIIENDLKGKKILDFGCGKGYNSRYLSNKGYEVIGADVIDYVEASNINFIKIQQTNDILKIPQIDTTLLFTVLHHIDQNEIPIILNHLAKISKRLIIIEDTFDLEFFINDAFTEKLEFDLLNLPEKSRNNAIILTDFYGNVISQDLSSINLSFQFKKCDDLIKILSESGFEKMTITPIGFPRVSFHGFFQIKIVCDKKRSLLKKHQQTTK